ncbi:PRC and DUF2382 domain-containing protein [Helcobacillus massiliensis]|uniref:PRC and DUF2382 domain-containing protein n=1 Tax=Helcobacillus massiliensis TaxID=521392 RepID=UPI002557447C|nr:PRC and DUF2382 domain-containing protein [Helcobacillus massiliensis]MDK7741499.1 PRC and DUF2382 domain-containing protein [Helcobacillus massiliensis]WOO92381.1 PRC and DUF2382 domain-containing protein [Helcobacillus massiliensis]
MTFKGNINELQSAEVVDSTGDKLGKVGQLYLTDGSQEPSWVTVNLGLFGSKETFIPLADAKFDNGVITVPYEKSFIKDAPNVEDDGKIDHKEEEELYRYYGVAGHGAAGQGGRRDNDLDREAGVAGGLGHDRRDNDLDRRDAADHDRRDAADQDRRDVADRDRTDVDDADGVTLHAERAEVGTERKETGQARLRKYVVEETEQVEVPVRREEVVLEREPGSGKTGGTIGGGTDEDVTVTLHEERPVVSKETVETEKVRLGTKTVEDTETVNTTVAHEEVDLETGEQRGDVAGDKRDLNNDGKRDI